MRQFFLFQGRFLLEKRFLYPPRGINDICLRPILRHSIPNGAGKFGKKEK